MDELDENSVMDVSGTGPMLEGLRLIGARQMNVFLQLTRHGHKFFVKGINHQYADRAKALSLLRKEYDLGMRLEHRGIVRFVSMEKLSGVGECIIMEWIDGITLGEWMRTGPSRGKRVRMAGEIIDAVGYMAQHGVAHRDLKPDNIMVRSNDESPCLIDFGHGDSEDFVTHKLAAGTATFGAPEQHNHGASGCEVDVYALGKILKFLRLPKVYAPLTNSCLRENPSSRPKASEVRSRFDRNSLLGRYPVAILTVVGLAVAAVALLSGRSANREITQNLEALRPSVGVQALDDSADVILPETTGRQPESTATVNVKSDRQSEQSEVVESDWETVTGQKVTIPQDYTADKAYDKALKQVRALFKTYDERLKALRITDNSKPADYYQNLDKVSKEIGEAYGNISVRMSAELNTMGLPHDEIMGYLTRLYNYYDAEFKNALGL